MKCRDCKNFKFLNDRCKKDGHRTTAQTEGCKPEAPKSPLRYFYYARDEKTGKVRLIYGVYGIGAIERKLDLTTGVTRL